MSKAVLAKLKARYNLNVSSLNERIRLQKTVFLLQNLGMRNLKYRFGFYIYGPYSSPLASDAYALEESSPVAVNFTQEDEEILSKFDQIALDMDSLAPHLGKDTRLEMLSDILFLKQNSMNKQSIREELADKHSYLDDSKVFDGSWDILKNAGLISA